MTDYVPVDRCEYPRRNHKYAGTKVCQICGYEKPWDDQNRPPPRPRPQRDTTTRSARDYAARQKTLRRRELERRINQTRRRERSNAYQLEARRKRHREHSRQRRRTDYAYYRDIATKHLAKEKLKRAFNPDYDAACRKRHTDHLKRMRATNPVKWEARRKHQLEYHKARYHKMKHDPHWRLKKNAIRRISHASKKGPQVGLECLARHRKQYEAGRRWREAKLDKVRTGAWMEFKQAQVELERWCWAFDWLDRWQARLDAASQNIVSEEKIG